MTIAEPPAPRQSKRKDASAIYVDSIEGLTRLPIHRCRTTHGLSYYCSLVQPTERFLLLNVGEPLLKALTMRRILQRRCQGDLRQQDVTRTTSVACF